MKESLTLLQPSFFYLHLWHEAIESENEYLRRLSKARSIARYLDGFFPSLIFIFLILLFLIFLYAFFSI